MKQLIALSLVFLSLIPFTVKADPIAGKALVDNGCQQCHDNNIYTRKNSIIHSFEDLEKRVQVCEQAGAKNWTPQQKSDVIEHLNGEYYNFPLQSR